MALDLKRLLMRMGNKLVTDHGFNPSIAHKRAVEEQPEHLHSTHWIGVLTEAINQSREMRLVLSDLGIDWPMPGGQHERMEDGHKECDGDYPQGHQ
jgi:hypothetical protein